MCSRASARDPDRVQMSDGRTHSFEWGPKSLFALPLNARYQHFNTSGRERARLASTNNLAMMLNLFHNEAFVFENAYEFPERQGAQKSFSGEGEFIYWCDRAATCGRPISCPIWRR